MTRSTRNRTARRPPPRPTAPDSGTAGGADPVVRLTVTTTDDADDRDAVLSLREAIEVGNGTLAVGSLTAHEQAQVVGDPADRNTIDFAIPGPGVQVIYPRSSLPAITRPALIDGYSQPGSRPNALAVGDDAVLLVQLDGSQATDSYFDHGFWLATGLTFSPRAAPFGAWSSLGSTPVSTAGPARPSRETSSEPTPPGRSPLAITSASPPTPGAESGPTAMEWTIAASAISSRATWGSRAMYPVAGPGWPATTSARMRTATRP